MQFIKDRNWIIWRFATIALGFVFLAAAVSKAIDPRQTVAVFLHFAPEFPGRAMTLTRVLILFEIVIAGFLLCGVNARAMLGLATVTLGVFLIWLLSLLAANASISCGCGMNASWLAPGNERLAAVMRNIVLIGIGAVGFAVAPRPTRPKHDLHSSKGDTNESRDSEAGNSNF